jgi:hypothetical protein
MLVLASSAMGFTKAEKKHEKKQNAAIGKAAKAAARALNRTAALTTAVGDHTKSLADLQTASTGIDNRLKTIEAGVPLVFDGLTKLGEAATQLKDGLTALSAGTTAGFTKVTETFRAVEYGSAGVYAGTTQIGPFINSPDIPDDGNGATATGSIPAPGLAASTPLVLRAAIRSNEADGAATGDPAGQVGGLLYATCGSTAGCGAVPSGAIGCTAGPPPTSPFVTPAGTLNLALVNIQQKSPETDPTTPGPTGGVDATGGTCTIPTAGTWIITAQAQFFDLPTSATPGHRD